MSVRDIKEQVRRLLETLPDDVTWDELIHEIYVRQSIEMGLMDSQSGKYKDVAAVRNGFGLS